MDLNLRCSATGCQCNNFVATKEKLRVCDGCPHSWLTHLLDKLVRNDEGLSVLDVSSLALYGTHALPIRLKIVIERLLSTLQPEEIDKILQSFGWTPLDLARGYMIQDRDGAILTRWSILPRDEEPLILEQFRRFAATRNLTTALLRKDMQWEDSPADNENSVLNLSSTGPSSLTSESMSDDDGEPIMAVDLSSKSEHRNRERDRERGDINRDRQPSVSPPIRKQHWSPPGSTTVNTVTGKRRVECSVCLKTFCDKGALKIHFSAVHLREMHKCTVSGCSMMFSSRRSRNRHSANPNPKLHSPHMRRKISPHDGRTCQSMLVANKFPPMYGAFDVKQEECISPTDDIRKNGARKRKLSNPMRLSSPPDGDTRNSITSSNFDRVSPSEQSESNPGSPSDPTTPLRCLATKVFHFNNHFQNLHLNALTERWCESLYARPRLDLLFDKHVPAAVEEDRASL